MAGPNTGSGVRIKAPARLHLGLIDMNGDLGRRFGSIGLAVDKPFLDIEIRHADTLSADGPEADRALRYAREAADLIGVPAAGRIVIRETMPAHAGFGSGTQLALSLAAGLGRLNGVAVDVARLGAFLERGARSGIGVASFLSGGFVVDGGRGPNGAVPPVIARMSFPEAWRMVLILDPTMEGVHGPKESAAFQALPLFPAAEAAHLCRLVMMRLLPGLAEADIAAVGAGLTEIQARLGDHFAPAQGGLRFTSPAVGRVLDEAARAGAPGVGQSSWGPTGFVLVESEQAASKLIDNLVRNGHTKVGLQFLIARGRNHGATIETIF
ncbi:beta-ribofuranosylaminobenzene 5'-phosphate synthase family protein [Chthonobacter albigriseus]|uniref:beta-ribofuranosylaminobenzene 5'-phosphate synthase family protein n=1 Tax=Chthonobacter albigriseus TaxID=1683161 RepID=UPI0015EE91D1|nr:beta-ribofuranosylaminobenzene 5'-phosphate synthase family protein [Chthonobacter albigriseus]